MHLHSEVKGVGEGNFYFKTRTIGKEKLDLFFWNHRHLTKLREILEINNIY